MIGKKTNATRRDVARAAGVSVTTVTHALNPPPGVRMASATRERVRRAARRLGYRPSFIGRALVRRRNFTVGLLQPARDSVFRRLYQSILFGMALAMEQDDYHLLMLFRETSAWRRVVEQGRLDGLFILESDFEDRHIREAEGFGIPVVVVNKSWRCMPGAAVGCVQADHWRMMDEAVSELLELGRRRLVCVVDAQHIDSNRRMLEGFENAVALRRAQGVHGSQVMPDAIATIWNADPRPNGIITDGSAAAETVLSEAIAADLLPARDFHLISTSTKEAETTASSQENSAYTEQPELMGRESWGLMKQLLENRASEREIKVPYLRHTVLAARH